MNNTLYNSDPRTNHSSNDLLGLVSKNNVHVDQNAPYDMEIDAYIMALNRSFGVDNYDSIPVKGTLTVYGGITQLYRSGVGTFNPNNNQKTSGYTKNYDYDTRLANIAPPHFPAMKDQTGRVMYKKVRWSEI